ncbi:MAG TPA: ABC transporter substrate-binding protein, partial [Flexilinea sp.]|nr:ABC transporter substrate-binding protein [Flexilinea sp.]
MKKNILYVVLFLLIFAVLPVNAAGDTLVIGVATDMTGMDPHQQTAFTSMKVLEMMYGQLVEVNENMEVVPSMAESWEWSEDGMHLTMHLVPEMTFHDGSPVTSADVKYSFERILNEETAAAARSKFTAISSIDTPDDLTVVFNFGEKNVAILVDMASTNAAILSKAFMENGGDLSTTEMGSGPY